MLTLPSQDLHTEQELLDYQARYGEEPEWVRGLEEELAHFDKLIHLEIPVPPQLEEAIGYDGDAQYVAFYWQPAGDEVMYDDGHIGGDGDWWAWLAYVDHPTVAPHLVRPCQTCDGHGTTNTLHNDPCLDCDGAGVHLLNLGSSDYPADHWLIVDREERQAYAAPVPAAAKLLADQWPPQPELSPEERIALYNAFQEAVEQFNREWTPPSEEEITARLIASKELCADMKAWLDSQIEVQSEEAES